VEARDRNPHNKPARTQEFAIRISADKSGADKQLADFEKSQDTFREKLVKLIADQAKVREAVEKLNVKYAPLGDKIKAAQAKAQPPAGSPQANDPARPQVPELDPETAKQLQALRQELAELAKQEDQNTQLGQQIGAEMKNAAEQAGKLPLMPSQVADQLDALAKLFQQAAVRPLQDLAGRMNKGKDPKEAAPDMKAMQNLSDRLQKELEALQARLKAVGEAEKDMHADAGKALDKLRAEMLRQDAKLSERDLAALKDFIAQLRKELQNLKGNQQELMDLNQSAKDLLRPELEKEQSKLEKRAERPLRDTRDLQSSAKMKKMRRRPKVPNAPYDPETEDRMVPPKEEDTDDPDEARPKAKHAKKSDKKADKDKKDDDEEEPLYMPALGGPKPKLDPRFANKRRPVDKKGRKDKDGSESMDREELANRQAGEMKELSEADESLGSDEKSLEGLMDRLRQAADAQRSRSGKQGQPKDSEGQSNPDLGQLLGSRELQQALQMAAKTGQLGQRGQRSQGQTQGTPASQQATTGNLSGRSTATPQGEADLDKLDLPTRTLILKMQPKLREELLQGMREEGPEGYRKFIQDYFKRLSKEKSPK
jgi:hypothetical protein